MAEHDFEPASSTPAAPDGPATFLSVIESALSHIKQRDWKSLSSSLLATPYLIHDKLADSQDTDLARGAGVRQLLWDCVPHLQAPGNFAQRYRKLLTAYYFENKSVTQTLTEIDDLRALSRQTFNTNRHRAIQALADVLLRRLKPALRLESPPRELAELIGRSYLLAECTTYLLESRSVLITGAGGVGKTTLASHAARPWKDGRLFWYTVRLGLNDHVQGFLFELALFLQRLEEPVLWSSLIAQVQSARSLELAEATGIVRASLERLTKKGRAPLFVIDDHDLLNPSKAPRHADVLGLLEQVNGLTPLLIVGQRSTFPADAFFELDGFSPEDMSRFLSSMNVLPSPSEAQSLWAATRGNPRVLQLFAVLYHADVNARLSMGNLIRELQHVRPLEYLLSRIIAPNRMTDTERGILMDLVAFRGWAPSDVWNGESTVEAFHALVNRHLLIQDDGGGVALLPAYRKILKGEMSVERRATIHQRAAAVRAVRAQYVEAAYHLTNGNDLLQALQLWKIHSHDMLNQGQAAAAASMLRRLVVRMRAASPTIDGDVLQEAANELSRLDGLLGKPRQAILDLRTTLEATPVLEFDKSSLEGEFQCDVSDYTKAEAAFRHALSIKNQLILARSANVHKGLAYVRMRSGEAERALSDIQRARLDVFRVEGEVHDSLGHYAEAELRLKDALTSAEQLEDINSIAEICTALSGICARHGRFDEAMQYQGRADACLVQLGFTAELHLYKINWAFIYILSEQYSLAKAAVQAAFDFFESSGNGAFAYPSALLHQGMGEACLHLGELDEAEHHLSVASANEEKIVDPDLSRTYGELLLARGRPSEAESFVQHSVQSAVQNSDPYLEAYGWRVMAKVLVALGDDVKASKCRERAIDLFNALNLDFEARRT